MKQHPLCRTVIVPALILCVILGLSQSVWADDPEDANGVSDVNGIEINVSTVEELMTAAVDAKAGDTIVLAEGTYNLTSSIVIKSGVTYKGAGAETTIIDGGGSGRVFIAWGDRTYNETSEEDNDSGPTDWIIEGLTIQNSVADGNEMFSYAGTAYNMLANFADNDDGSGGLDLEEADAAADAIRLNGPDGIEQTIDDDIHRFEVMDTDNNDELSEAEIEAQLLSTEVEFPDQSRDGGALYVGAGAVGTIENCVFQNNHTPPDGRHGGAIFMNGLSTLTINNCNFFDNYAVSSIAEQTVGDNSHGGHIKMGGDSASAVTPGTTLIVNNCTFAGGRAHANGGAIQAWAGGNIIRINACLFYDNSAGNVGSVLHNNHPGAGELTITNSLFFDNKGSNRLFHVRRNTKIVNCTFLGNETSNNGIVRTNAAIVDTDGDGDLDEFIDFTEVVNCLFVNNTVKNELLRKGNNGIVKSTNCLYFGNMRYNGNDANIIQAGNVEVNSIEADPLLDESLIPGPDSPVVDAGVDPITVGVELLTDYSGNPRPQGAGYDIGPDEIK